MKKVEIELSSEQAQDLLFALKLRACQQNIVADPGREHLRQEMNNKFTKTFGWCEYPDRYKPDGNIRVSITSRNRW